MIHLNEAVAKRTTGKYVLETWETKEGITEFLEENGFVKVDAKNATTIRRESERLGDVPVYAVGEYTSEPTTHWIKLYSPKWENRVLFCRENEILKNIKFRYGASLWSVIIGNSWNDFNDFNSFRDTVREKLGI